MHQNKIFYQQPIPHTGVVGVCEGCHSKIILTDSRTRWRLQIKSLSNESDVLILKIKKITGLEDYEAAVSALGFMRSLMFKMKWIGGCIGRVSSIDDYMTKIIRMKLCRSDRNKN